MSSHPIFIHSLFRTGSTYVWNKFRQNDKYDCYYEPLNQFLSEISKEKPYIWGYDSHATDKAGHPRITKNHLAEYEKLLQPNQKGIPFFKKSFSFDDYCNNSPNPDLKKYIAHLIHAADEEGKRPVLQFNRTAFRIKWFKTYFPGSTNIYLVRNPRDQWESYAALYKRSDYIGFYLMDLIIASMNKDKNDFLSLANHLPLLRYNNDQQDKENNFYRIVLKSYSEEEKYLIFYYTWFRALVENVLNADFILNINLLSKKLSYKEKVTKFLREHGIRDINFKDAKITEYSLYSLAAETMDTTEETVRNLLIPSLTEDQINGFFQKISLDDRGYFQFKREDFIRIPKEKNKSSQDIQETTIKKFEEIVSLLAKEWFKQIEDYKRLHHLVKQKELQIKNIDKEFQNKDLLLAEKDLLISREGKKLQPKVPLLSGKNEALKQKETHQTKEYAAPGNKGAAIANGISTKENSPQFYLPHR